VYKLAQVRSALGKLDEAEPLFQRALRHREKTLGPEHAALCPVLESLAGIYARQRKYAEAEAYYRRLVAIAEKSSGVGHAVALERYAGFLRQAGREQEATIVAAQAQAIRRQSQKRPAK